MTSPFHDLSAADLARAVGNGTLAPAAVAEACFRRADVVGAGHDGLNIVLYEDRSASLSEASRLGARLEGGEAPGVLAGVPVAIKDNIATLGLPTTCGSRVLAGYRSPFEATAVERLRRAGAEVVAKTNMDEFAMARPRSTAPLVPPGILSIRRASRVARQAARRPQWPPGSCVSRGFRDRRIGPTAGLFCGVGRQAHVRAGEPLRPVAFACRWTMSASSAASGRRRAGARRDCRP